MVYDYYGGEEKLPQFAEMVKYADKMDSASLTLDEILHPKGWVLLGFISDPRTGLGRTHNFTISNLDLMKKLAENYLSRPIDEILALPDVQQRIAAYHEQCDSYIEAVKQRGRIDGNAVIVDMRGESNIPSGNRFLLYTLFPNQNISIWVIDGKQKQNCAITVGYSIIKKDATVDVGSLMLKYGGGGHKQVGTCQVAYADTDTVLAEIIAAVR